MPCCGSRINVFRYSHLGDGFVHELMDANQDAHRFDVVMVQTEEESIHSAQMKRAASE